MSKKNDSSLPTIVALLPRTMLKAAKELIEKKAGRPFNFKGFACNIPWEKYEKAFFKACESANLVILHNWVRFGSPHDAEYLPAGIAMKIMGANGKVLPETLKDKIKGFSEFASFCPKFEGLNPQAKIFALPTGGVYDAPIHKVDGVNKVYFIADDAITKALMAV